MPFDQTFLCALAVAVLALHAVAGNAQDQVPVQSTPGRANEAVETGKERLSDKASDDQRVDNCKVPPERRGPKIRPDGCRDDVNAILID